MVYFNVVLNRRHLYRIVTESAQTFGTFRGGWSDQYRPESKLVLTAASVGAQSTPNRSPVPAVELSLTSYLRATVEPRYNSVYLRVVYVLYVQCVVRTMLRSGSNPDTLPDVSVPLLFLE